MRAQVVIYYIMYNILYYSMCAYTFWKKKNIVYRQLDVIVFHVSIDPACIIIITRHTYTRQPVCPKSWKIYKYNCIIMTYVLYTHRE